MMSCKELNDETIPQLMELIDPKEAEERYKLSEYIAYPFAEFADEEDEVQEIRLFKGDLHVENTEPTMDRGWNRYNLIIDGNLTVDNDFFWAEDGNGCFILVTGNVKAYCATIKGNADVVILGDLEVEHDVITNYGEDGGALVVRGAVKAPVFFEGFNFWVAVEKKDIGTYISINEMDSGDKLLPEFLDDSRGSIRSGAIEEAVRKGEQVLKVQQ